MDPRDRTKCYLVFQTSKQAFMSMCNVPTAPPNQQSINPFLSRWPQAALSYTFNQRQLQLLQQQQQELQSQHNSQRRTSRLRTILDCGAPVLPVQYGMFLPQPRYDVIPCGAAKRIRLEEVADQQPSNGSVISNNTLLVSARLSPVQEAKVKPTQSSSQSLGVKLEKDNRQYRGLVSRGEVRKATRGKRKRSKEKKMDMDIRMDVDTELRL